MKSFINKYPALSLFGLSVIFGSLITWLVLNAGWSTGLLIFAASSATLSAIILTAIADGKAGLKKLFGRLLIWKVGIQWWLWATFFLVPLSLIAMYINALFGGPVPDLSNLPPVYSIIPLFILYILTAGLGEELGWRGFLLPRLQLKYSALVSSLIIGFLWGIWHAPMFFIIIEGFPYAALAAKMGFIPALLGFTMFYLIPWSILYTWIFNNTRGSLLLVCIFHGSEVWVKYFQLNSNISMDNPLTWLGYCLVMVVTALVVVLIYGPKNLSRTVVK